MKQLKIYHLLLITCLFYAACSNFGAPPPEDCEKTVKLYAWELWTSEHDLQGNRLKDGSIIAGDQLVLGGDREGALQEYLSVNQSTLNDIEREALIFRIASTSLSLSKVKEARTVLKDYFIQSGMRTDEVRGSFALLYAFVHQQEKNYKQSIAWFVQASKSLSKTSDKLMAVDGIRELLNSVSEGELRTIGEAWSGEPLVASVLLEESRLRALQGGGEPFPVSVKTSVEVLLPLSGRLAPLGQSVRSGMRIAFAQATALGMDVRYRDSEGDSGRVSELMKEIGDRVGDVLVVGPLMGPASMAAAKIAEEKGIPLVSLSKSGKFVSGNGIFRLGPTVESETSSLVEVATAALKLEKVGVLYPNSPEGYRLSLAFKKAYNELGNKLALELAYSVQDKTSIAKLASKIKDLDAVFIADGITAAARLMASLPKASRKKITLLGPSFWYDSTELLTSQKIFEGAVFVSPFFKESLRAYVLAFISTYNLTFRKAPDFLAAQGFDVGALVLSALEMQVGLDSFTLALKAVGAYQGLTGTITIGENGELKRRFSVVQIKQGKLTALY